LDSNQKFKKKENKMKNTATAPPLSIKALSTTFAVLSALGVLIVGLVNLSRPEYGSALLALLSSVYPGYDGGPALKSVLVLACYAAFDGLLIGALFAIIYNLVLGHKQFDFRKHR
jgi:hypothetical protein